jgi:RHS repeat-associated protein
VKFGFGEEIVIEEDGYIYIWVSNESQSTRVWFDDLTVTHEQSLVVQASDYGVWGDLLREQRSDDKKYRFGYQGQFAEKDEETGWNHFELREYENTLARWLVVDPKRIGHSPYVGMDNDPLNLIDPDGGNPNDWYRNNTTNEVVWIEDSDAVEGHTHLSANALDPSVINAVSESIRSGGIEAFLMYFNDERLGKDYFFNLSHTFDVPRDGWLATVIDNSPVVSDAFHISEWTHTTIANGTEANNALEHHIGTFLMTYRWGPDMATVITTANEVRGLIINDRQSGNVVRALEGAGGTAFEWSDLGNNAKGLYKYARWHLGEIFSKKAWSNFTNFRSWEEIKALPKAH